MTSHDGFRTRATEGITRLTIGVVKDDPTVPCDCSECFTTRVMGRAMWPIDIVFALVFFVHAVAFLAASPYVASGWDVLLVSSGGGMMFMAGWAFADFRKSRKNMRKGCK